MPLPFICTGVTVIFLDCHAQILRLCSYSSFILVHLYACFCMYPHLGPLSRPLRRRARVTLVLSGLLRLSTLAYFKLLSTLLVRLFVRWGEETQPF